MVLRFFGNYEPHNKVDKDAGTRRKKRDKNKQQAEEHGVNLEIFSQTSANAGNLLVIR